MWPWLCRPARGRGIFKRFDVIGFDVDKRRIASLKAGNDWTGEIEREALLASPMQFTDQVTELQGCDFFVVAVPTPVDEKNNPDFSCW